MTIPHPAPTTDDPMRAQFLLLAESVKGMVVLADAEGRVTWASAATRDITGFAPDELVGRDVDELVHSEDLPLWRDAREGLGWGLDGQALSYRSIRRGGGVVELESVMRAVRDDDGQITALQIVTIDDTDRALADREHAALSRITEAVAAQVEGTDLHRLVAQELGQMLGAAVARVARTRDDGREQVLASVHRPEPVGDRRPPHVVSAAVRVNGRLWGSVSASFRTEVEAPRGAAERVERVAQLLALGVANAQTRARLVEQATTDALTGLVNHETFHAALAAAVAEPGRDGRPLALAVIDLDRFKALNDSLGHRAGDDALAAIGDLLRRHARRGDVVGRTGGEELAWLMPDTGIEGGHAAAERLRDAIARAPVGGAAGVTASIGVTERLPSDADADEVFRRADAALYEAKAAGRDRVVAA